MIVGAITIRVRQRQGIAARDGLARVREAIAVHVDEVVRVAIAVRIRAARFHEVRDAIAIGIHVR